MDGRLKSRPRTLSPDAIATATLTPDAITTGTALRTREQVRLELLQASDRENAANYSPRDESSTDMDMDGCERLNSSGDTGGSGGGNQFPNMFEQSRMYVDRDELLKLRRRPPVAFVVRNTATKEEELQAAVTTRGAAVFRPTKRGQSWHSPVHVPLSHRKLVQPPEIFREDPPFRPIAPRAPTGAKTGRWRDKPGNLLGRTTHNPTKLTPMPSPALEARDQLSDRSFVRNLREKNKELFDRLVQRFATLRRVSIQELESHDNTDNNVPINMKLSGVEDAILFFLDAKHKHDVLYFKRKNARGAKSTETAKLSLGLSSASAATGKYMPYDLERIDEAPRSGAGDYFMMTSSSLVHHTNNNDNGVSGEVIPLSQWIMESKMFSLLLAGIPLFQKFLVRKTFVGWVRAIRRTIYRDNCKRIARCLPFARPSFVRSMLLSSRALRDIQQIRSLTLPTTRPAVDLVTVQEHQKEHLAMAEMRLIDAKEKLLSLMEEMVQNIYDDLDPPTNLDELYNAEAASVRTVNAKWKSAPIAAMRQRKTDLQRQKDAAVLDMSLLETYIRMLDYMFTESLYLMIIGCVQYLRDQLSAEENSGAVCAAVAIVGDSLELTPSLDQTKHIFLDGIARLIRLVSNFHFTKNATTWSNNRGTGLLAVVAESFNSSDLFSSEFDLQSVLRKDPKFDKVTKEFISELSLWFDQAAQQMLTFESLRVIYVEVHSARKPRGNDQNAGNQLYLTRLIGIPGGELSRFLKNISHRLNVLDRSQHACQKVQSSWKVGFLEIQCRNSISEILELISQERNSLHQKLYELVVEGVTECVDVLQRATLLLEDRPQLIEFFCEQMKQVRLLKEGEKQLNQNIRNVDETVRSLKRFAPSLGSEVSAQYNAMHQFLGKYTALIQSHAKFAAKVLPNITYQVNSALQKYSLRCQKLLKMYDEFSDMEEQEEMEKNVGVFQEVVRELSAIEKATKLYQEYQKMVGLKVVEILSLAEAMTKWGEVQELVTFTLQWLAAINSMENGIFSEQNWEIHAEKVHNFLPIIRELQSRGRAGFAEKLLANIYQAVIDYLRKLSLVKEMAQPWVKIHHWKEILKLMNILNYVSSIGVLITDGYTVTLGFLRSRDLWKYELQIREITQKAHHDAVAEKKLSAMKSRLQDAVLPIIRVHDSHELDLPRAIQLLESFEDDLLTIQSLAQVTASGFLRLQLVQWRDDVRHCEEVLDKWIIVQRSRTKLSLLFSLRDVQQSVTDASFEFEAIDRKWRGMMHSAKGTAALSICLREVVTIGFLVGAQESYAKLWLQLGTYLDEKRKYFPRFNFLSDHDLFQLIIYARDPNHLPRMVSKCFRGINSLRMRRTTLGNVGISEENEEDDATASSLQAGVDIDAIYGIAEGEELPIKPLRVSANPQLWMKELDERRILRGVLQSNSMWLLFSGVEVSNMLKIFAQEMNQIVDAFRAHQTSLVLDGCPIDITNNELAVVVTCSLDYQLSRHQQVFLRLSSSFAPISCPSVSSELIVEALLLVNGFKDWNQLSEKLETLFCLLMDDSVPFIKDLSLHRLPLSFAIVRNVTLRLDTNSWQSAEKSLIAAIWDEIHTKVLPERRVAFLKCIRTVFPHAADLEINAFGKLALRAPTGNSIAISSDICENSTIDEDAALSCESDEEDENYELKTVKFKIETAISSRRLSVSEFYVRKLLELYQIVSKQVFVIVVGRGACGKSTAINVLSSVFADEISNSESSFYGDPDKQLRTVRLYPEAFNVKDIYGEVTTDSTWDDGFFSHFFRQNCVDVASIDSFDALEADGNSSFNPQPMRRRSLIVPEDTTANRSLAPASWIVFDGVQDASTLLEPLRGLVETSPKDTKKMVLPNGDQLECTQESLRIFCEVESLQHWSPAALSRCGMVYMQTEHMVPYTLLIKSWLQQQQPKRKRSSLAHLTKLLEPTSEFVAKLMRTHLPSVLDVFKRYSPPFLECSVTHGVANMLQIVTPLVAEIAKGVVEDDAEWMTDARIVVAYAATISLGMILPPRGRMEFHLAAIKMAPQVLEEHPIFTLDSSATLFDVGLRFQDHRVVLFLWSSSVLESSKPTRRSSFAYQSEFPRRTSAVLKARGRIVTSEDTEDTEGDEELRGDTSTITSPLSVIYVPTAATVSCGAWLKMIGLAKANAFVVGESAVGKTLVMENCLRELGQKERVSATALQINGTTTGFDIQRAVENGMTGKLKGAHCPGVGKRALVLLLDNLNLDTQDSAMHVNGPCSAMIRQVIDGKGSFIKSTKEYVEFRDLAVWCSFSVSNFGYPRVPSRLLRHFHVVWLPDQTDQVFAQVVPMFTSYFRRRYEGPFGGLTSVAYRLSQFPIQMFKRGRKLWKPSAATPYLLFSIGSVLSVFLSLMNASLSRVPADPATEFELLTLYLTLQLHRNRFLEQDNRDQLHFSALRIAKKLGFSCQSLVFLRSPEDFFFADCGDTEGITRITAKAITTLFVSGEERFHWNQKPTLKAEFSVSETESGDLNPRSSRGKGTGSVATNDEGVSLHSSNSVQETVLVRRSSLAMFALKNRLPDEKVTAALSFYQLQNTLDVYSFLQSGVRHLLLSGSDTADRRSTTMVACGTLSFQFREISTELRLTVFIEHVKAIVLEAGLKATQTVLYVEFEDLIPEEVALLVYLIRQDDLPPHVYSSADKVKLHAIDHHPKGLATPQSPINRSSFLQVVTSTVEKEKPSTGAKKTTQSASHLLTIFRENVRRSLYFVLSIGCKAKLLEFMTQHPSVYYRFVSKTFPQWQDVSAEDICNSTLQEWSPLNESGIISTLSSAQLRDMILIIYRTAENCTSDGFYQRLPSFTTRGRRFGSVTTRLDDMLRVFKILFAFHSRKLENQLRSLRKALDFLTKRLTQTNVRVAKEETSEIAQNDASQAVTDVSTQLTTQESIEKEARRLFLLDEERCDKIQSEIEIKRASIQHELSKTLPDVQEATEALSQINKYHIVEMKSFTNPPQLVRLAMQAVCVLLDVPPTWSEALRILADIRFLDRLRNFDKDKIDPSLMDRVKFYVNHPNFSMENMRRASLASTTLCKWVLALVRYFEAMKRVAPTRKLLEEIEQSYHIVVEKVQAEKKKLMDIEIHLSELRVFHAQKIQQEAELQRTQETRQRWKSSVTSFGQVVKQWHDATKERLESVEKQRENLLMDCVLVATLITFGAEKCHEEREKIVCQCREVLQKHFSSYPMAGDIPTMIQLSGEGLVTNLQKKIVDMLAEEDEAFATSLFLMDQTQQVCFKIPFLVDPLDRGVSWIKQVYSNATPSKGFRSCGESVVADAGDPLFLRAIETCLAQSPPSMVLVENASEGDEVTIEAALELIVLLKEKSTCAVYFAAKSLDKAASWLPKTWSHFAVVDFTPTRQDLDNYFLTLFCHSSSESVHNKIESIRSKLCVEKAQEETLFKNFLMNLCAASDEAARASTVGLSSTAVSILSAGLQGFYNEDSMERISTQLDDFVAVRQTRTQLQEDLRNLYAERRRALPFARRARALVLTERGLARLGSSLHLSLSQTLENVGESLEESLTKSRKSSEADECWHSNVSTITVLTTTAYIRQRLAGIPTSLRRTYMFLLVLSMGEIDGEDDKTFELPQHFFTERVVQLN
ncbi:hypothetical protein PI124_g10720 [Phytophthora idaei]|nr:hypothetical protein PI124_g10720 [Phytophthora idaei]